MTRLRQLARLHGVETVYRDVSHRRREASPEAVLLALKALGAPVESFRDVPAALRERRRALWARGCEPVAVAWQGGPADLELRLPERHARGGVACRLTLESGEEKTWTADLDRLRAGRCVAIEGERFVIKRLSLPRRLPWGYHRLVVETRGGACESLIISAPRQAYAGADRADDRAWGVFLPLYALHSERSWGAGDFTDLEALAEWVAGLGGSIVGTLPLLPVRFDDPVDPSPYAPVSRLFWNEFYVDVTGIPELGSSPRAQALLASADVQQEVAGLRAASLVDYRRQMAVKRGILGVLAESLSGAPAGRQTAFRRFVNGHPRVDDYACFRAAGERRKTPWPQWPAPLVDGLVTADDYDERARRYHCYAQWVAHEQMERLATTMRGRGLRLFLDLPLGVHPHSYDVWRERDVFAPEVSGGAPPDAVFTAGQDWAFPPLHPEKIRTQGYRYVIAALRHQMRHAGLLRIDHVMGFHRLFWIPRGHQAREGVYVRYPAEELYGILTVESHRHRTRLVGENLGTVPAVVNATMARHALLRMYVVQYELGGSARRVLRAVPRDAVAGLSTHDMPPFAAYWEGLDIDDRLRLGLLTPTGARVERKTRRALHHLLARFLTRRRWLASDAPDLCELLKGCLRFVSASPAQVVLVNLEDLWLEREPQNVPTTGGTRPNWRRKARHHLETFREMAAVRDLLGEVDRLRRRVGR